MKCWHHSFPKRRIPHPRAQWGVEARLVWGGGGWPGSQESKINLFDLTWKESFLRYRPSSQRNSRPWWHGCRKHRATLSGASTPTHRRARNLLTVRWCRRMNWPSNSFQGSLFWTSWDALEWWRRFCSCTQVRGGGDLYWIGSWGVFESSISYLIGDIRTSFPWTIDLTGYPTRCPYDDLCDRYRSLMPDYVANLDSVSFSEALLMALGMKANRMKVTNERDVMIHTLLHNVFFLWDLFHAIYLNTRCSQVWLPTWYHSNLLQVWGGDFWC